MSSTEHSIPDATRLYIGEGVTIKGEVSVPDTLVVCGVLEGHVTTHNLIIGKTGVIKGRIAVAENAEVFGTVAEAEKLDVKCLLILRSTASVDGNISYGLLQIEQGASITGGLSFINSRAEVSPPKKVALQLPSNELPQLPNNDLPLRKGRKPLKQNTPSVNAARSLIQPDESVRAAQPVR
ncbi:MAG: polymer-forming cytoskeletal protein [Xanthobacteraceae bacterium]|nr:polymer-forming cytoskeletal protein [Xanthobacteraceae bacterium]